MTQDEHNPTPLMILSDAPTAGSGLARITNDLATRIATHMPDVFRVCTFGYGGACSRHLPYHQYVIEGMREWIIPTLPETWRDWAEDEHGILLTIWDASRLGWLSQPEQFLEQGIQDNFLRKWLIKRPFELWGYFPIDSSGPQDRLTFPMMKALYGYDRILACSKFGENVIRRTLGDTDAEKKHIAVLPHGIDSDIFYETDRKLCRRVFLQRTGAQCIVGNTLPIADDELLIGCVGTNQSRKDYSLVAETFAIISSILAQHFRCRLWIHTEALEKYWSIPTLLVDFGILDRTVVSTGATPDENMAEAYSACDLTLGLGLGEGMGYPIHESLFCGTPCIHGNYGAAPEWMVSQYSDSSNPLLVEPVAYRYEGFHPCKRPVFRAHDWAEAGLKMIGKRMNHCDDLDWNNLWPRWEAYLREAAK